MTTLVSTPLRRVSWGILLLCGVLVGQSSAQRVPSGSGAYVDHGVDDQAVRVEREQAHVQVALVRPSVVRVDCFRGQAPRDTSVAVVASPRSDLRPTVREGDEALYIRGGNATVVVEKSPLRVRIASVEGTPVFQEASSNVAWTDTSRTLRVQMAPDTRAYGTGERPAFSATKRCCGVGT